VTAAEPFRIAWRRLHPDAVVPVAARPGDAGLDLCAVHDVDLPAGGGRAVVGTGVAVGLPWGYAALVLPRSGLARNHGVTCLNTPGLIDAGYRGELQVLLVNTDPTTPYTVHAGDRIAQLLIVPFPAVELVEVDELEATDRGEQGWGHTGR